MYTKYLLLLLCFSLFGCNAGKDKKGDAKGELKLSQLTLTATESATLSWSWKAPDLNATCHILENGASFLSAIAEEGEHEITPMTNSSYDLYCTTASSEKTLATIAIEVSPANPKIESFLAEPATINLGTPVLLSFAGSNLERCDIFLGEEVLLENINLEETIEYIPDNNETLELVCEGPSKRPATTSLEITINPPQNINFESSKDSADLGEVITFNINGENVTSCELKVGENATAVVPGTPIEVTINEPTDYELTCSGPSGTSEPITKNIDSNPPRDVVLSSSATDIDLGTDVELTATGVNVTACELSDGTTTTAITIGAPTTVSPAVPTAYKVTCTGPGGSAEATVNVGIKAPRDVVLTASVTEIDLGESVDLTPTGINITACELSDGTTTTAITIGTPTTVSPAVPTAYKVTCTGPGGSAEATVNVGIKAPRDVVLAASATEIDLGGSVDLTPTGINITACELSDGSATSTITIGAPTTVSPSVPTEYKVTCTGPGGSAEATVNVGIKAPRDVELAASATEIDLGDSVDLTATGVNTTSCMLEHDGSSVAIAIGTPTIVSPSVPTDYKLTCSGPGGTAESTVNVAIKAPRDVILTASATEIDLGDTVSLTASGVNITSCELKYGTNALSMTPDVAIDLTPDDNETYILTCEGPGGSSNAVTKQIKINPPRNVVLTASATMIDIGDSVKLTVTGSNINECFINYDGRSESFSIVNGLEVSLTQETLYTLNCSGPSGAASPSSTTIKMNPPRDVLLTATANEIDLGEEVTLIATGVNITSCTLEYDGNTSRIDISATLTPTRKTEYTLRCEGPGGSASDTETVSIKAPRDVKLTASKTGVDLGETITLIPTGVNITSCDLSYSGNSIALEPQISKSISITDNTNFTLICEGPGGKASSVTAEVKVNPPRDITFVSNKSSIDLGSSVGLTAEGVNINTCQVSWKSETKVIKIGEATEFKPVDNTSYRLDCSGPSGTVPTKIVEIKINTPRDVKLTSSANEIDLGEVTSITATGVNITSCEVAYNDEIENLAPGDSLIVSPTIATTYTLNCTGPSGSASNKKTIKIKAPRDVKLTASKTGVDLGERVTLTATGVNITSCKINDSIAINPSSTISQTISDNTIFNLRCEGPGGFGAASETITINAPRELKLAASKTGIDLGESVSLTATGINITSCELSYGGSSTPIIIGTPASVSPTVATDYSLKCEGPGGMARTSQTIAINPPRGVSLNVSSNNIDLGEKASLTATGMNITSCELSYGTTSVSMTPDASIEIAPDTSDTYILRCEGPGGSAAAVTQQIKINPPRNVSLVAESAGIDLGASTKLTVTGSNITECFINYDSKSESFSIKNGLEVSPTKETLYTLNCSGPSGAASPTTTTIRINPPRDLILAASASEIDLGESPTLTASGVNVTSCELSYDSSTSSISIGRTQTVRPTTPTEYRLTCSGPGGRDSITTTISIKAPRNVVLAASKTKVDLNDTITLTASGVNTTSCSMTDGNETMSIDPTGSISRTITDNTEFSLNCEGPGGSANPVTVAVTVNPPRDVTFVANKAKVDLGESLRLQANGINIKRCTISYLSETKPVIVGEITDFYPEEKTSYRLDCEGPGGISPTKVVDIGINPPREIALTISPISINEGEDTTLTVSGKNVNRCEVIFDGLSHDIAIDKPTTFTPYGETEYTLECVGPSGKATVRNTVNVILADDVFQADTLEEIGSKFNIDEVKDLALTELPGKNITNFSTTYRSGLIPLPANQIISVASSKRSSRFDLDNSIVYGYEGNLNTTLLNSQCLNTLNESSVISSAVFNTELDSSGIQETFLWNSEAHISDFTATTHVLENPIPRGTAWEVEFNLVQTEIKHEKLYQDFGVASGSYELNNGTVALPFFVSSDVPKGFSDTAFEAIKPGVAQAKTESFNTLATFPEGYPVPPSKDGYAYDPNHATCESSAPQIKKSRTYNSAAEFCGPGSQFYGSLQCETGNGLPSRWPYVYNWTETGKTMDNYIQKFPSRRVVSGPGTVDCKHWLPSLANIYNITGTWTANIPNAHWFITDSRWPACGGYNCVDKVMRTRDNETSYSNVEPAQNYCIDRYLGQNYVAYLSNEVWNGCTNTEIYKDAVKAVEDQNAVDDMITACNESQECVDLSVAIIKSINLSLMSNEIKNHVTLLKSNLESAKNSGLSYIIPLDDTYLSRKADVEQIAADIEAGYAALIAAHNATGADWNTALFQLTNGKTIPPGFQSPSELQQSINDYKAALADMATIMPIEVRKMTCSWESQGRFRKFNNIRVLEIYKTSPKADAAGEFMSIAPITTD